MLMRGCEINKVDSSTIDAGIQIEILNFGIIEKRDINLKINLLRT
jgi:hypothetical protein